MGYDGYEAQLMSAPPYVVGAITTIVFAKISDRVFW